MIGRLRQLSEPRLRQQAGIEKSQTPVERDILIQRVRIIESMMGLRPRQGNLRLVFRLFSLMRGLPENEYDWAILSKNWQIETAFGAKAETAGRDRKISDTCRKGYSCPMGENKEMHVLILMIVIWKYYRPFYGRRFRLTTTRLRSHKKQSARIKQTINIS